MLQEYAGTSPVTVQPAASSGVRALAVAASITFNQKSSQATARAPWLKLQVLDLVRSKQHL